MTGRHAGGYVEKPPHVDEMRMRHIGDADLVAALDPSVPALAGGPPDRPEAALRALRRTIAADGRPGGPFNAATWAAAVRGTEREQATVAAAAELHDRAVDFTDPAHGRSGLYGFHYLGWTQPLLRAYALTGEERQLARWAELFEGWYDSRDRVVGEWPGLDVVWYTLGVASRSSVFLEALPALAGSASVSDGTFGRVLASLLGGARWLAEEHDAFRYGNWQFAGCAALLHLGGVLPEFRESATWAAVARERLEEHLDHDVHGDGGHRERSPSYHTLCLGAMHTVAVVGEQRLGWPVGEHPRFVAMHDWLLTLAAPGGWVPPFNDSHLVWAAEYLLKGHYFLGLPAYKAIVERDLSPERVREILAALPARPRHGDPVEEYAGASAAPAPARSVVVPDSGYAVLRGGSGRDAQYAAVNYGPYIEHELESHSHHSVLDIVLAAFGVPLVWEAGGPSTYDDPLYYSWYQATGAHSTVVVEGRELATERGVVADDLIRTPEYDAFSARHVGYGDEHRRTVISVPGRDGLPGYWVVRDRIGGAGPFTWLLQGRSPWRRLGEGRHVSSQPPGVLVVSRDVGGRDEVSTSSGPTRWPDPANRGSVTGELHTLALHRDVGRYDVLVVPFAEEPPDASMEEVDGRLVVRVGDRTDVLHTHS